MSELKIWRDYLRDFAEKREWTQFHSPKNLAMALSVEAAELLEHFQWLTEEQSANPEPARLVAIADEIADVQLYLIRLADRLNIDIAQAVVQKTQKNEEKYPVEKVRGSSRKYNEY